MATEANEETVKADTRAMRSNWFGHLRGEVVRRDEEGRELGLSKGEREGKPEWVLAGG